MAIPLPAGASLTPPPLPKGATLNAPEQGNMYTQNAEDIQYDPMSGMPLNTSSYGSGPTGYTNTARLGLTTAAALPINIATGVAKNAGGVAQTLGKYFGGGQTADNMVNAINQIESGTQAASGDTGGMINAVGSAVGQAAPWLATGGGAIPSFAKAVERGFVTGGASALATPEEVGLTPEQFAEAKKKNIMLQAGVGAAFPFVGKAIGAGYNAVKGAVEPFYEGGRNKIIGRALREFAGNDADTAITNLRNAPQLVKGSLPTVGQSAGVPSLAALERTAMATSPEAVNALAGRKAAQSAAQANALEGIANPALVARYTDRQNLIGDVLYADALKPLNLGKLSVGQVTQIKGLTETPAIKRAMEQAKENAANRGMNIADPAGSMRGLHETKMALDEQIGAVKAKLERDGLGATSAELDGLNKAKDRLLGFMETVSPAYKTARETYAKVSKPVEQLNTIKDLAFKSVSPQSDAIKAGQYLNNLKKLKAEGTLSDAQYKRLEAIAEDIKRASAAETSGRGVGSDTVQKLAYSNMLNLQGIPNALRNFGPASFIGNVAGRVGDVAYGGANTQLKGQLAETLMDPAQAARLMEQAGLSTKAGPKTEKAKQLAKMLMMQTTGQAFQGE